MPATATIFQTLLWVQPTRRRVTKFISVRRSTSFRRFFHLPSGVQNCSYNVKYLSDRYCYLLVAAGSSNGLYVQFWAPDDGRKNRLKYVEGLTEINKLWHVASWLYCANILAMHGTMNVNLHDSFNNSVIVSSRSTVSRPNPSKSDKVISGCSIILAVWIYPVTSAVYVQMLYY